MARSYHAAVCLDYGKDSPQVLITGGFDQGDRALSDVWILDVLSGCFKEVSTHSGLFVEIQVWSISQCRANGPISLCPSPLEGWRWGKVRIPLLPPS